MQKIMSPIDTTLVDSVVGQTSFRQLIFFQQKMLKKAPVLKQDTSKSQNRNCEEKKK